MTNAPIKCAPPLILTSLVKRLKEESVVISITESKMTTITLPVNDFHSNARKRLKSSGKIADNFLGLFR